MASQEPDSAQHKTKLEQYAEIAKSMYRDQRLSNFKPGVNNARGRGRGGKIATNQCDRLQQAAKLNDLLGTRIDYDISCLPGIPRSLEQMLKDAIRFYPKTGYGNNEDKRSAIESSVEIRKLREACEYLNTEIDEIEEQVKIKNDDDMLKQIEEKKSSLALFETKIDECVKKAENNTKMNFNDAATSMLKILSKKDTRSYSLYNHIKNIMCPSVPSDKDSTSKDSPRRKYDVERVADADENWRTVVKTESKFSYTPTQAKDGKYVPPHLRDKKEDDGEWSTVRSKKNDGHVASYTTNYNKTRTYEPRGDRYEQRSDRYEQRSDRYESRGDRYESRGDRYESRGDRYEQRSDRYEKRDRQPTTSDNKGKYVPPHLRKEENKKEGVKLPDFVADFPDLGGNADAKKDIGAWNIPIPEEVLKAKPVEAKENIEESEEEVVKDKKVTYMPRVVVPRRFNSSNVKKIKDSWDDFDNEGSDDYYDEELDDDDIILDETDVNQNISIGMGNVSITSVSSNVKTNAKGAIAELTWSTSSTTTTWGNYSDED